MPEDPPASFVTDPGGGQYRYFSLGEKREALKAQHGLTDAQLFDLFTRPFLDEVVAEGHVVHFTRDPEVETDSDLHRELEYVLSRGYRYDPEARRAYSSEHPPTS